MEFKYRQKLQLLFQFDLIFFFFLQNFSDMKSDRNSTLKKTEFFSFNSHSERWTYPRVLLLCTQNTCLGTDSSGVFVRQKKSTPRWPKKKHSENWKIAFKIGENAVVWLMLFSFLAPLQDVVLAQVQLEVGDCQELWIKHTKCIFSPKDLKGVFCVPGGNWLLIWNCKNLFLYIFFIFMFLSLQTEIQSLTSRDLGVWPWLSDPFLHPLALLELRFLLF